MTRDLTEKSGKLTRVISTKLSIEDYYKFLVFTNDAYKAGVIEEPKVSKYLRYLVTQPFKELGL